MSTQSKVHFLTGYLEYLLDQGIKSEYYYLGDASRYLRFLIKQSGPETIEAFLGCASSPAYRRRLIKTLRKFYAFANEKLELSVNPMDEVANHPTSRKRVH